MQVTNLVRRGKSELYKIFLDGEYICLLEAEVIVKHKIQTGLKISSQQFEQIRKESENLTCKNMAINYVSKCLKSRFQVFDYLKHKGFLISSINDALDLLEDYGYLNDKYFAEAFIKSKQNTKGKMYLVSALKQKGIKDSIIDEAMQSYEVDEENIIILAQKYLKNKTKDEKTKQKLYRHLLSKGFTYEQINKVLSQLDIEL